jgi:hypothetical protein
MWSVGGRTISIIGSFPAYSEGGRNGSCVFQKNHFAEKHNNNNNVNTCEEKDM